MKRRVWPQLFCRCFNVTDTQRAGTVIIIINISCNTVICRDPLLSLWARQTGEWVVLEVRFCLPPVHVTDDWTGQMIHRHQLSINSQKERDASPVAALRRASSPAFALLSADFCGRYILFRQWWAISGSRSFFREIFAPLKWLQLFDADGCLGLIPDFWLILQQATFNSPLLLFAFKHSLDPGSSYKLPSCLWWAGALWVNLTDVAAWFLPHQPHPVRLNFNKCHRCISPQPLRTVQASKLWSASSLAVIDVGAISEAALT